MCDYIKPELRHQPDIIILNCGTNDNSNEINILKKLKKLLKEIEEYDTHKKPRVAIFGSIKRYDQDFNEDITSYYWWKKILLMKKLKVCAHPNVCLLLTIAAFINHVWIGVSSIWIEEVRLSWEITLRNL